jgi:uncharacterized membrane protein
VSGKRAERRIRIDAAPSDCFDALLDYERMPEWQGPVRSVDVLSRNGAGRARRVAFEIDARLKTVSYVLDYSYDEPHRIAWEYVEGDVRDVEGEYLLEEAGGGTLATYSLRIDPGVWLPGLALRMLSEQVMRGSMEDLKRHVEAGSE